MYVSQAKLIYCPYHWRLRQCHILKKHDALTVPVIATPCGSWHKWPGTVKPTYPQMAEQQPYHGMCLQGIWKHLSTVRTNAERIRCLSVFCMWTTILIAVSSWLLFSMGRNPHQFQTQFLLMRSTKLWLVANWTLQTFEVRKANYSLCSQSRDENRSKSFVARNGGTFSCADPCLFSHWETVSCCLECNCSKEHLPL